MARFVEVCGDREVIEGRGVGFTVDGLPIALYRHEGVIHALHGRCPHAGGPMGGGWIVDGRAACPLHRWKFDLASGRCLTAPGRSLHVFRVDVRDGRVWVEAGSGDQDTSGTT